MLIYALVSMNVFGLKKKRVGTLSGFFFLTDLKNGKDFLIKLSSSFHINFTNNNHILV